MPDLGGLIANVKDPWLIAAVRAWVIVGGGAAALFVVERAKLALAESTLETVKVEKRRFDVGIGQTRRSERIRDSSLPRTRGIRTIDADPYALPRPVDQAPTALPPRPCLSGLAHAG